MEETKAKQNTKYGLIILLVFSVYVFNVASKNLYSAEVVEILKRFAGATKAQVSFATTVYFISYAAVQIIISMVSKKLNVLKVLFYTTVVSSVITGLIPFCTELWQVYAIFFVNGVLQAITWPACVYTVSNYIPINKQSTANLWLSLGFAIAFFLDYFSAAIFIKYADWRYGFWVFAVLYLISDVLFYLVISKCRKVDNVEKPDEKNDNKEPRKVDKKMFSYIHIVGCAVGLLMGMVYYGVLNWVTVFFNEIFGLSSSDSAFISLAVPLCACLGPVATISLCNKKKFWPVGIVNLLILTAVALTLSFVFKANMWLSLILIMLVLIFGRGNSVLVGMVLLLRCQKFANTTSMAAITNTFGSIGAAIGPVTLGAIIDASGFFPAFLFITLIAVVSALLIVIFYRKIEFIN